MKVSSWLFCLMLLCGTAHGDKLNVQREKCIHFDQRPTGIAIDTIVLHASERNSLEELTTIFNHK
ncbi:MAG: hypothetical protein KDD62_04970, partial [Bdellovibrionales bacterium]|nr:hypothetical protein [Bdellovibrionales bacterium]